jgi:hypothetical protein
MSAVVERDLHLFGILTPHEPQCRTAEVFEAHVTQTSREDRCAGDSPVFRREAIDAEHGVRVAGRKIPSTKLIYKRSYSTLLNSEDRSTGTSSHVPVFSCLGIGICWRVFA